MASNRSGVRAASRGPSSFRSLHTAVDLATNAHCPDCGNQVVLYVCFSCNKPVWPDRGPAAA